MGAVRVVLWALLCAALAQGALATTPPFLGPSVAPRPPATPLVLHKCCPLDQVLDDGQRACVPLADAFRRRLNITSFQDKKLWWADAKVRVAPSRKIQKLSALALTAKVLYKKQPCDHNLVSMLWSTEVSIYLNGSLEMQLHSAPAGPAQKLVLPPEDFCVDRTALGGKLHLAFLACPCKHVVCVRKCCDNKRMMTISETVGMKNTANCAAELPKNFTWTAPFTTLTSGSELRQANVAYARLRGPISNTCTTDRINVAIEISDTLKTTLLPNGTLKAGITGSPFSTHHFCLDYVKDNRKDGYFAIVCANALMPVFRPTRRSGLKSSVLTALQP